VYILCLYWRHSFILAPNAAGATMGVFQLLLKLVYPAAVAAVTVVNDHTALLNPA
jgi:hypothetical protein